MSEFDPTKNTGIIESTDVGDSTPTGNGETVNVDEMPLDEFAAVLRGASCRLLKEANGEKDTHKQVVALIGIAMAKGIEGQSRRVRPVTGGPKKVILTN